MTGVSAVRLFALLGAANAFLAVAAGAFGAHGLKKRLPPDLLDVFEVGARYHMYHALGLFAVAWLASRGAPAATAGGWLMLAGIVVFSGSLYALSLTGQRWLGAITPFGGVCFLAAWACVAWGAWKSVATG
jgi:uncharacterized membrane protein YgdD (TMEM256/DUF423 family)